jgi:hypothetical protein
MIIMSNFSNKIFQSGLSLLLSKSHDTIRNDDIIAFKFVSKLNATVFIMCEETEDLLSLCLCLGQQLLCQLQESRNKSRLGPKTDS